MNRKGQKVNEKEKRKQGAGALCAKKKTLKKTSK
jgi:hypothetical protein